MTDIREHNATPRAELERQIMDPNIPKNEREWWAAAEIERLRALLLRHQVAAWCEEDSDLAVETRRALETKP